MNSAPAASKARRMAKSLAILFRRDQHAQIERINGDRNLDPPAAPVILTINGVRGPIAGQDTLHSRLFSPHFIAPNGPAARPLFEADYPHTGPKMFHLICKIFCWPRP